MLKTKARNPGLLLAVALLGAAARPARAGGPHLGIDAGVEAGPYRGWGTGVGSGIEAGWNLDKRRSIVGSFNFSPSERGDADPNIWVALEGRYRAYEKASPGSAAPHLSLGLGIGLNWTPLPRVDAGLVTIPIEWGWTFGDRSGASIVLAVRERLVLAISDGDPAVSFLNRLGPAVMLNF